MTTPKPLDMTLGSEKALGDRFTLPTTVLARVNIGRKFKLLPRLSTGLVEVAEGLTCKGCVFNHAEGLCVFRCVSTLRSDNTDIIFKSLENPEENPNDYLP